MLWVQVLREGHWMGTYGGTSPNSTALGDHGQDKLTKHKSFHIINASIAK